MDFDKPVQPPPAIVIKAQDLGQQFGLPPGKIDAVVEARRHAIEKIDQFVAGLNSEKRDPASGYYVADKELVFKVDRTTTLKSAVTQALRLPDERLLTAAAVDGLIAANSKSDPQLAKKLTELRDSLGKSAPALTAPIGTTITMSSAEGTRYQMLQNQALIDMLNALPESQLTAQGKKNRDEILVFAGRIGVHKEVQALGLEIERDNSVLRQRAEDGTLKVLDTANPRLETLAQAVQRAKKLGLPEQQMASIDRIVDKARAQSVETAVDVSQRAAQIAELRGDGALAARYLAAAKRLAGQFEDPAKRDAEIAETKEQARLLFSRTLSADLVKDTNFSTFRKKIDEFFDGAEADFVMAQSLVRAAQLNRQQQLMKGASDTADPFGKDCFKRATEAYTTVLEKLGLRDKEARQLSKEERVFAYEASNFVLEGALRDSKLDLVDDLVKYRRTGIKGAPQEEFDRQDKALQVRLARAVFEAPAKYSAEITGYLGVENPGNKRETHEHLLKLVKDRIAELAKEQKALAEGEAPVQEQRTVSQDLSEAQVSLSRMLVSGVVSHHSTKAEKMEYYRQLDDLNGGILKEEKEIIDRLKADVEKLEKAKLEEQDQGRLATIRDRIEVLKAEVQARQLSAATLIVQQAEVALYGDLPELTHAAKELIEKADEFGGAHPGIRKLVETFRKEHNPGSLRAAAEAFLNEVNKDYPPYVLGAMIAAGILGSLAGYSLYKNRPGALYGFMAASCLTLATVKVGFGLAGIDQVGAAWQTGLSPHSPSQDFLNVLYLGADMLQAWPLIPAAMGLWALSRMKGKDDIAKEIADQTGEKKAQTVLERTVHALSMAGREGVEFGKAVISLADPRTLTFWLLTATIGTASYQVLGSDLPAATQSEQMTKLGLEVMQTLAIAIIYDRIAANLKGDKKEGKDDAKETADVLNNGAVPTVTQPAETQPAALDAPAIPADGQTTP